MALSWRPEKYWKPLNHGHANKHIFNLDFFRQLAKQEPMIIRDQRFQVEWLAKNKYPLLLFPRPAPMMEFIRAGATIAYGSTPVEGTYLASGSALALLNRAPHPNAAKIFINWFLSREGQIGMFPEEIQSTRLDASSDGLDTSLVRKPGVKYFDGANTEEYTLKRAEYEKIAKEIFGDLVR